MSKNTGKGKKQGKAKIIIIVLVALALLFFALINFMTDLLWFKEVGYISVFLKQLVTQVEIGVPLFVILLLLSNIYLRALKRNYIKKIESDFEPEDKKLNRPAWLFSILFAGVMAFFIATRVWFDFLQFTHSTSFNIKDPLFKNDVSFYIFKLSFIQQLNVLIIGALIGVAIITILYHSVLISLRPPKIIGAAEPFASDADIEIEDTFEDPEDKGTGNGGFFKNGFNAFGGSPNGQGSLFEKIAEAIFGGMKPKQPGHTGGSGGGMNPRAPFGGGRKMGNSNFKNLMEIASKQLCVLGVLLFAMIGVNFFLRQFDLLYSRTGVLYGAGFTDVNITLWVYRILIALSLIGAVTFVLGVKKRDFKKALLVPALIVALGAVGTGVGYVVQNWVVSPDEINKESKYLKRNIQFTQQAYGLADVVKKPFKAIDNLTAADIAANEETMSNIRINDYEPVKKFYNQTQSIRQYYDFQDVDVDRYMINGEYTQTFLSAREIDESRIRSEWLNQHLKYTHGYGITLSRVDQVTASGQPAMQIDSIPPISRVEEIQFERPEIYFGEKTNNYILVNTQEDEFDYPDGDTNKYCKYEGTAGIKLNPLNRLMFSIRERSVKMFVSSNITGDSKIILNRDIKKRVRKIMPMLQYEKDPYMVAVDGKLYWIIDAYTTSTRYPYSEPFGDGQVNYIRNSIKVVVDAYNGTTNFYIVDENDPMAATMKAIYPVLFKTFEEMPDSLKAHIRYPHTLFAIQAEIYKRYHMNDVKVFYLGEDLWDISKEIYGTNEVEMKPNYYILKLPGEDKAEFVSSIPYTPRDKKNMTALMIARNDGEHYGELVLYQLPKSKIIYGPMQIEAQIDQSTEISKEFSLWNSSGSKYNRGNMFVIPINDSLLYVEPVYLEATNSSIPEVKRVIVAYGDRIAYEPTLAEAIESLFGEKAGIEKPTDGGGEEPGDSASGISQAEIIIKLQESFDAAQQAQRNGDWAGYGEKMREVQKYIEMLK